VKVLFDTNIVLDVLLDRQPHADAATRLFALVDGGMIEASLCATTVTSIYYIAAKTVGRKRARTQMHDLLALFSVAAVDHEVLDRALDLGFEDYEDAVVHEAARVGGMTAIVSRDAGGFAGASLPVFAPSELLAAIAATAG
jgi:predicted nucleic acid-binding protein